MDREYELVELLRVFPRGPEDERALRALVAETITDGRLPARVAARLWAKGDDDVSMGAYELLQSVADLAIEPLIAGLGPADPTRVSQGLDLVVHAELELRAKVVRHVDGLLVDKRRVPPPQSFGAVEETPDDRRVCDEAYVAMRRLVHYGESAWDLVTSARQFYRSPEGARDAAITEARRTNEWRRALRGPDAGDDEGDPA